jgi:lysophospholipase L1-like esterase
MKPTLFLAAALACSSGDEPRNADMTRTRLQPTPTQQTQTIDKDLHVVTIGDSLAYGAGDENGKGIAGRLEEHLLSRGATSAETVNLGVNGAQTSDLISRLKVDRVRKTLAKADAIVLSIGANDLFRSPGGREQVLKAPFAVADRILGRVEQIVQELHAINPEARILILGGYNPVPDHQFAPLIDQYLLMWDASVASRFERDPLVSVVKMSDIVTRQRLSRYDHFHPGGAAYEEAAKRIAALLAA